MKISHESLEIILDLIEIKMNVLQIHDRDDAREANKLRKCKQEFLSLFNESSLSPLKTSRKERPLSEKSSRQNG
ncbi:MAG: hypothetical protein H0X26_04510 [Alphaproteobacteria bacterium]|nr:hypothetical protein [Alphaproteobacteria bacterium]